VLRENPNPTGLAILFSQTKKGRLSSSVVKLHPTGACLFFSDFSHAQGLSHMIFHSSRGISFTLSRT